MFFFFKSIITFRVMELNCMFYCTQKVLEPLIDIFTQTSHNI